MDGPARIPAMVALCFALLVPGASPATARGNDTAPPPETESAILDDVFDDFLSAYNRRSFGALRELYETRFTTAALEDRFSGPAGAARERLRLYHHYGPLERVAIDSAGPGRVYWARGTVSGGWLGFEWVPTVAGERVERAILWRLTPGHHAKFRALGSEVAADSVARYLASMEDAGLFSGVVLVAQGDEVLLEEAYGLADRKNDVANKVDTRFNIASAGKLFTGVALMQLAERGQLGLDDPVTEYVPEYPAEVGARTTIGHLLEHTSQIELDDIQAYREAAPKVPTLEALIDLQIRILQTEDVRVQPGGGFDYSNEAIDLAGLILHRSQRVGGTSASVPPSTPTLLIENARVIVGDGTVLDRGSVVVAGDQIVSVTDQPVETQDARRIDASGKTVLPGLIDAHVHITPPPGEQDSTSLHRYLEGRLAEELRRFLEHGVTTLRSTGDYWPWSGELRDQVAAGEVLGPRIVTAGPAFTAEGAHPATTVCSPDNSFCRRRLTREITSPAQAQEAVQSVAKAGVDFIKLVSDSRATAVQIEDEVVEAIVEQAHREGLKAVGHVSEATRMEAYAEMGLDGFVHPPLIPVSDDQTRRLARVLTMHSIPVTTTLMIPLLHTDEPVGPMLEGALPLPESLTSMAHSVAVLAEEGVSIVVGSDWFVADRHPALRAGAATHTEMELLQRGGMSEEAVIRAATANAAEALGLGDRMGTLEPDKLADLIVVDGNPLEDISALRNVELVVKGGEILVEATDER